MSANKQPTIRLIINADQITDTIKALENSNAVSPNALSFLHYLKKKELEIQLGLAKANYIPIPIGNKVPAIPSDMSMTTTYRNDSPMIVTPSNVQEYTNRILAGEVISLPPADIEEIKSFAAIMGMILPDNFQNP